MAKEGGFFSPNRKSSSKDKRVAGSQFFSETKKGQEWRKRIQQDAYVGLAIIFLTMGSCFLWVIFFYF